MNLEEITALVASRGYRAWPNYEEEQYSETEDGYFEDDWTDTVYIHPEKTIEITKNGYDRSIEVKILEPQMWEHGPSEARYSKEGFLTLEHWCDPQGLTHREGAPAYTLYYPDDGSLKQQSWYTHGTLAVPPGPLPAYPDAAPAPGPSIEM